MHVISLSLIVSFLITGMTNANALTSDKNSEDTTLFLNRIQELNKLTKQYPDSVLNIADRIFEKNQILFTIDSSKGSIVLNAEIFWIKGRAMRYKGDSPNAEEYYNSALEIFQDYNHFEGIAKCMHEFGNLNFYYGDYKGAYNCFKRACHIRDSLNLLSGLANSLTNLGSVYSRMGYLDSAELFHLKSLEINTELVDTIGITASMNNLANIYSRQSNYEKALEVYMEAIAIIDSSNYIRHLGSLYNNIGYIYLNQGSYIQALDYFKNALYYYEKSGDLTGSAHVMLNIGNINIDIGILDHAHDHTSQALSTFMLLENKKGISDSYFQMGRIYTEEKKVERAKRFFEHSLTISKEINDRWGVGDCFQNLGTIYFANNLLDSAEFSYLEALSIYDSLGYTHGIVTVQNNLSDLYLSLNKTSKSIYYAKESLKHSTTFDGFVEQMDSYKFLSKAYEEQGQYRKSIKCLKKASQIRDSIYNQNTTKSLFELEIKHQSRNMERAMEQQQLLLSKREAEIASNEREHMLQQQIRNILIGASLFLILLLLIILRVLSLQKHNNKKLKLQKNDILSKNVELEKLNEELRAQQEQIEVQHEDLIQQKDIIDLSNYHLKKDIKYANFIQQAILPSPSRLNSVVSDSFVLYHPKELVGGDFYYVSKKGNYRLIAVGDCTGHGVPGGFLTMLGMSLLKSIINEENIKDPTLILKELRDEIIEVFEQTGQILEQVDGIDIGIVVINDKTNELHFSGGRGNAIVVSANKKVELLKGDRIALSFRPTLRDFSLQKVLLKGDEKIYMYTDGYTDQFNSQHIKFGRKRFIDLCTQLSNKPFSIQKARFLANFELWGNGVEQIDDMLVFAFKAIR